MDEGRGFQESGMEPIRRKYLNAAGISTRHHTHGYVQILVFKVHGESKPMSSIGREAGMICQWISLKCKNHIWLYDRPSHFDVFARHNQSTVKRGLKSQFRFFRVYIVAAYLSSVPQKGNPSYIVPICKPRVKYKRALA